jgi:hypothetical protein
VTSLIKKKWSEADATDEAALADLQRRLEAVFQRSELKLGSYGVFCRLSTLSPKDAVKEDIQGLVRHMKQELVSLLTCKSASAPSGKVLRLRALEEWEAILVITRPLVQAARRTDATSCLQLLLRSERAMRHIQRRIREHEQHLEQTSHQSGDKTASSPAAATPSQYVPVNLCLRRWQPDLDAVWEFRCYVHNRRMTAVSHYYKVRSFCVSSVDSLF